MKFNSGVQCLAAGIFTAELITAIVTHRWEILPLLGCLIILCVLLQDANAQVNEMQGIIDHALGKYPDAK